MSIVAEQMFARAEANTKQIQYLSDIFYFSRTVLIMSGLIRLNQIAMRIYFFIAIDKFPNI